jgi:hypothetical protein
MNIITIFESIGKQMLTEFEGINSQIKHSGGRGGVREDSLKLFLETHLPHKYAICKGEVVDSLGNTSRQCDLIIYDRTTSPIFFTGETYQILPAESVYAVIEVKSVLNDAELKLAIENIQSVKSLQRENGKIGGILFAYKSAIRKNTMDKLSEKIRLANSSLKPDKYIDLLCVLEKGIICLCNEDGVTKLTKQLSERTMWVYTEIYVSTLLWFFINLLDLLDGQVIIEPDLIFYLKSAEKSTKIHPQALALVSVKTPNTLE